MSEWRLRLPRVAVVAFPLLAAAVSVSALWLIDRGYVPGTLPGVPDVRDSAAVGNGIASVVGASACGLFLRDKLRSRLDDMLGAGVYAFLVYAVVVGMSDALVPYCGFRGTVGPAVPAVF